VSRPALSSLLNGKADLSGGMPLRIGKDLRCENGYPDADATSRDIAQTGKREKEIRVQRIRQPAEVRL
jgi:hypothetical protein